MKYEGTCDISNGGVRADAPHESELFGDLNGDCVTGIRDVTLLLLYLSGKYTQENAALLPEKIVW